MTIRTYPFSWLTPLLVPIFESRPERLSDYLSLTRADWHYVGLIIALMGDKANDPEHFAAIERDLLTRKRKAVLADVAPEAPDGLLKLVPKLAGDLWRPQAYRRLAEMVRERTALMALRRQRSIRRRMVRIVHRLPSDLRTDYVIRYVKTSADIEEVLFAILVVRRIRTDLTRRDIIRSFGQVRGKAPQAMRRWVQHHYEHAPFPDAPWVGTETVTPIKSFSELRKLALEFDNCVRNYHLEVMDGQSYFYRYAEGGMPIATVELISIPNVGWAVSEIAGPKNDDVPPATVRRIHTLFADAGIEKYPASLYRGSWFHDYD